MHFDPPGDAMHHRTLGMGIRIATLAGLLLWGPAAALAGDNQTFNSTSSTANDMVAFRGFDPTVLTGPSDPHPDTSDLILYQDDPNTPDFDYLAGSTEFGWGLTDGASDKSICMNRLDCTFDINNGGFPEGGALATGGSGNPVDQSGNPNYFYLSYVEHGDDGSGNPLFKQGLRSDMLSYAVDSTWDCRSVSAISGQARCSQTDNGFHQDVALTGPGSATGPRGDGDQVFDMFFSVDALVDANGELLGDAKGTYTQAYTDVTAGVTTSKSCTGAFTYSTASGYTQTAGSPYECP
jgi:hypothetical protein